MTEPLERPVTVNMHLTKKQIMINNFLGGLAWGFGSVVGATVVVAIVGYILKSLGVFAAVGSFFEQFGNISRPLV